MLCMSRIVGLIAVRLATATLRPTRTKKVYVWLGSRKRNILLIFLLDWIFFRFFLFIVRTKSPVQLCKCKLMHLVFRAFVACKVPAMWWSLCWRLRHDFAAATAASFHFPNSFHFIFIVTNGMERLWAVWKCEFVLWLRLSHLIFIISLIALGIYSCDCGLTSPQCKSLNIYLYVCWCLRKLRWKWNNDVPWPKHV